MYTKESPNKFDDLIDSRDVIERLEELEDMRKLWIAGWNMPGYMPESDPEGFSTWEDAAEYIKDAMSVSVDESLAYEGSETDLAKLTENSIAWLESLPDKEFGDTVGKYHYWIVRAEPGQDFDDLDDAGEYRVLKDFAEQFEDASDDYEFGAQAIRDSYFKEYAMSLAEECGEIDDNAK